MTALLTDNLPLLAGSPNGIQKLRELILELAVRGKLVPQDPNDEPTSKLLKRIAEEKAQLVAEGRIRKQKPLAEIGEEEKPFELPEGWEWVRFGQLIELVSGQHLGPEEYFEHPQDGAIPYLSGPADFGDVFPLPTRHTFERRAISVEGDILLTVKGSGIGKTNFVAQPALAISRQLMAVRPILVDAQFARNMLLSMAEHFQSKSVGIAIPGISREDVLDSVIGTPPLAEQHRIVTKVDELMTLCDRLEARQADAESAHARLVQALLDSLIQASDADDFAASWQRLSAHFHTLLTTEASIDALKQTLLQLAVMGNLVPQDPSDEPASVLLKRIAEEKARLVAEGRIRKQKPLAEIGEEEKPFELPQGWEWARKAEVFNFLNGYAFKSEWFRPEGVRLLRNVNVSHGVANWKDTACISEEQAAEFQGFLLAENDVVLTLDRPIISTGLKYAVISSGDLPCLLLQRVAKIAPYAGAVIVGYLSAWLNSRFFVDTIDPGRSNGVPHISTNQVASIPFALPPLAEQHRIVAKLDQLMTLCDQLKSRLTAARQLHEQLAGALVEQAVA